MTFFTPIITFHMRKMDIGKTVSFRPGQLYHKTFLKLFDFRAVIEDSNNLDMKIAYLCTRWIKVVEVTDMHEVIKSLLLTQKGK